MSRKSHPDTFARMMAASERPWYPVCDAHGVLFLSPTEKIATRDQLIKDAMSIPCYTPTRDANGYAVMGEKSFWPLDKAERCVDAVLGSNSSNNTTYTPDAA